MEILFTKTPVEGYGLISLTTPQTTLSFRFLFESYKNFRKGFLRPEYDLDATASFARKGEHEVDCCIICNTAANTDKPTKQYLTEFNAHLEEIVEYYKKYISMICSDKNSGQRQDESPEDYAERLISISYEYIPVLKKMKENR